MSSLNPAGWLRGTAAGLLTAALAVAAHGVAGGGPPTGAAAAQLAVLAATVGALAASLSRAADTRVLLCLLAAGQLLGHVTLSVTGHAHATSSAPPAAAMVAAHLVAIAAGAVLIAAGDRLCRAVSRAVRAAEPTICPPVVAAPVMATADAGQPLRPRKPIPTARWCAGNSRRCPTAASPSTLLRC